MSVLLQRRNNLRFARSVLDDAMRLVSDLILADDTNESLIAFQSDIETSIGLLGEEINRIEIPPEEDT